MKTSIAIADISAAPEAFVVWRGFEESIKRPQRWDTMGLSWP